MNRIFIVTLISLAVGFAAASWIASPEAPTNRQPIETRVVSATFDSGAPLEQRIHALEQAVSQERQARQLLQEEVFILTSELERLAPPLAEPEAETPDIASEQERRAAFRRRNSADGRAGRLVAAGFQPGEAEWIVQRESELQMEALRARYDAERNGEPVDFLQNRTAAAINLRAELGDEDYARYLQANGRPTSVAISNVLENSPAQRAGLQPGDQILRYDGQRLFSMSDLTQQTMQGEAGVNVAVDIMRDGIPMQVVLPRGPVGISGGRRFNR